MKLTLIANVIVPLAITLLGVGAYYLGARGAYVDLALYVLAIGWTAQFVVLCLKAIGKIPNTLPFNKQTFSLWAACLYPVMALKIGAGLSLALLSALIGYAVAYALIALFLPLVRLMKIGK
jgi:hypothetical protein